MPRNDYTISKTDGIVDDMDFRTRLRECMEKKKLSAKDLAAKAEISVYTLNMYLGARASIPSADGAIKIARVLGVTVEYLIYGFEMPKEYLFIEAEDQNELYLKGKGRTIEVRSDARKSNAYLKNNGYQPKEIEPENPELREIASLLGILSAGQLEAFHKITDAYIEGVFTQPE